MKKVIIYFVALIIGFSAFTSCEDTNEEIILGDSDKFIAFEKVNVELKEEGSKIGILVYISGTKSGDGATVNFEFDTTGIDNPAVEGVDYNLINDSRTLSWNNYFGYDTIWIEPIDNSEYDKDKYVNVILSNPTNNYKLGAQNIASLKVADNEHPLSLVIGDYTINYVTNLTGGSDGSFDVTTYPHPDNINQIYFLLDLWVGNAGYPGTYTEDDWVICNIDLEAMTIRIASGQAWADGTYGPIKLQGFDEDGDFEDGEFIEGTIDANGNISISDGMSLPFTSGANFGYVFDSWKSSEWIKQ